MLSLISDDESDEDGEMKQSPSFKNILSQPRKHLPLALPLGVPGTSGMRTALLRKSEQLDTSK